MKRNPQSIALVITSIGCLVFLCLYISAQSKLNQIYNFVPSPEAVAEMKENQVKLDALTKEANDRIAEDNAKIQALTRH